MSIVKVFFGLLTIAFILSAQIVKAQSCTSSGEPPTISSNCVGGYLWNSGNLVNNAAVVGGGGREGISVEGTVDTLTNNGSINGYNNFAIRIDSNVVSQITNNGAIGIITGSSYNLGISNATLGMLINNRDGIISINEASANAIYVDSGNISNLINYGQIIATGIYARGIYLGGYGVEEMPSSSIPLLTNYGTISGGVAGIVLEDSGTYDANNSIGTLNNLGVITSTSPGGFGISNFGTITTLNNTQGGNSGSAATTALTYDGNVPTNYNIGIVSSTHYGQLAVNRLTSGTSAITNFGIYGTPLLTSRTYAGVLTNNVTITNLQAKYDNMTLALVNNALTGTYDLTFTGASLMGTQQSLVNTANALAPIYAMQNAVLVNSFTYDCTLFDVNNICISVGGRNTQVSAANGLNNTCALLIAAYRPHPNYRIGAYADQNLSVNNAGSTVNLSNNTPLIGIFGAWIQNQEGTGAEVRVSAAYGQKDTTITRQVVGLSEPGSGSSTLNSQGAQVTAKYGFAVADKAIVSPYVGVRYTQNNMGGYTEGSSATVTAPLTYSALNTSATTALAGVGASYKVIPTVTAFASAGVETDTNTSNGTYSATGINGLTPVNFNPNPVRTRPTATLGAYYDVAKNQRLGITGIYRQEAYQAVSTTTVMATYTIGL